jgi:hypothetical protein
MTQTFVQHEMAYKSLPGFVLPHLGPVALSFRSVEESLEVRPPGGETTGALGGLLVESPRDHYPSEPGVEWFRWGHRSVPRTACCSLRPLQRLPALRNLQLDTWFCVQTVKTGGPDRRQQEPNALMASSGRL